MKSSTELQDELNTLTTEQTHVLSLVHALPSLTKAVQRATTQHLLGQATVAEVQQAQTRLEDATQALSRKDALDAAIASHKDSLDWTRGQERAAFCHSIRDEYGQQFAQYAAESRQLLQTFKQMNQLHLKHLAMTGRPLMFEPDFALDLPAIRSPNDSANFRIGGLVRSGDLK